MKPFLGGFIVLTAMAGTMISAQSQKRVPLYVFDFLAIVLDQEPEMLQNGFLNVPNASLNQK